MVPTSLVGNWKREAARFVPDLKLLVLHGPDRRQRFSEIPNHHLVLTTYPLLNRDHEALFGHDYDTAIGAVQVGRSGVYFRAVYAQAPLVDQPCGQSRLQGSIAIAVASTEQASKALQVVAVVYLRHELALRDDERAPRHLARRLRAPGFP